MVNAVIMSVILNFSDEWSAANFLIVSYLSSNPRVITKDNLIVLDTDHYSTNIFEYADLVLRAEMLFQQLPRRVGRQEVELLTTKHLGQLAALSNSSKYDPDLPKYSAYNYVWWIWYSTIDDMLALGFDPIIPLKNTPWLHLEVAFNPMQSRRLIFEFNYPLLENRFTSEHIYQARNPLPVLYTQIYQNWKLSKLIITYDELITSLFRELTTNIEVQPIFLPVLMSSITEINQQQIAIIVKAVSKINNLIHKNKLARLRISNFPITFQQMYNVRSKYLYRYFGSGV